jgi:acetylornithine deacetylase/succinyl-diaminopimelate desuccinylase-like protein
MTEISPERIDSERMWDDFARFVAADTSARIGENRIDSEDERLASFASEVAGPLFRELGADVCIDELNNVVGRFGKDRGSELLIVAYPAIHHGNEMADPLRARRTTVNGAEQWVGLGASQSKSGLAAVAAAVRLLQEQDVELSGRVTLAISSEGSSSHRSAQSLYSGFDPLPAGAVLAVGTENRITLGNRGRADVVVEIHGQATHSSAAELGQNPILLVGDVQARVARMPLDPTPHDRLGVRSVVPYKLVCGPVAPHTIPSWCELVLDRRLLPGDEPETVVAEVARALEGLPVIVREGPVMLPALVEESDTVVVALQRGAEQALGRPLETFYPPYTYDAGYPCSLGVPTVMFGPSTSEIAGIGVLGEDFVPEARVVQAAAVYAAAIAANSHRTQEA